MKDENTNKEQQFELLNLPKRILESLSEVLNHDTENHNCRSLERGRLTWRLNNQT